MNNNYGGSPNDETDNKHPVLTSDQNNTSNAFTRHGFTSSGLNRSFSHSDEVEDRVVAKTLNELDADILVAMENLSITDDDLLSSSSSNQNLEKTEEEKGKNLNKAPLIHY